MKHIDKILAIGMAGVLMIGAFAGCGKSNLAAAYSESEYSVGLLTEGSEQKLDFMAKDLCVLNEELDNPEVDLGLADYGGLFSLEDGKVMYAKQIHKRLYPASTTKILTALVAIKYGNLNDTVVITEDCLDLEEQASTCEFNVGDCATLEQVLYGFLLCSGNDAGIAIANHISGSVEKFAELMNKTAYELGATNSHFVNPHGLHDENHYTTLYDLYLIMNEAMKNDEFAKIVGTKEYKTVITTKEGEPREMEWLTTNRYFKDMAETPENMIILGSKTGTTDQAGCCLVLSSKNEVTNKPYISIVMKSCDPGTMYVQMNEILDIIN